MDKEVRLGEKRCKKLIKDFINKENQGNLTHTAP